MKYVDDEIPTAGKTGMKVKSGSEYRYGPYRVGKAGSAWEVREWGTLVSTHRTKRDAKAEALRLSIEAAEKHFEEEG